MEGNLDACLNYCVGCFSATSETLKLYNYTFLCSSIKDIFKTQSFLLCYVCRRIAQHTEMFIQKIQSNQILLENFSNVTDETIKSLSLQIEPLVNLNKVTYNIVEVSGTEDNFTDTRERFDLIYDSSIEVDEKVKEEVKEEAEVFFNAQLLNDDNDFSDILEEEENGIPLTEKLEEQLKSGMDKFPENKTLSRKHTVNKKPIKKLQNDFPDMYEEKENGIPLTEKLDEKLESGKDKFPENKTLPRKRKVNKKPTKKLKNGPYKIKTLHLTIEQIMEERLKMTEDPRYLNSGYKCLDCIIGFSCKGSYDIHMEKHYQHVGDYECDLCKQRRKLKKDLLSHMNQHQLRYKCLKCGFIRRFRNAVRLHYSQCHFKTKPQYNCTLCIKTFRNLGILRNHMSYIHGETQRPQCAYCSRTYRDLTGLRRHMLTKHTKEMSATDNVPIKKCICSECGQWFTTKTRLKNHISKHSNKRDFYCVECDKYFKTANSLNVHLNTTSAHVVYKEPPKHTKEMSATDNVPIKKCICSECGQWFTTKTRLKNHISKHSNKRDFYCVECDKNFKTANSLNIHLNTTSVHVAYKELLFGCQHCDKRFSTWRGVTRHTNSVHLKVKPYACDKCDKAYGTSCSLKKHQKYAHDGYKRPLQFPCPVCDKIFDRNSILKNHIRIHTGERPYQCTKCPATFNQAGILRTHDRLVHLKLTRTVGYKNVANK